LRRLRLLLPDTMAHLGVAPSDQVGSDFVWRTARSAFVIHDVKVSGGRLGMRLVSTVAAHRGQRTRAGSYLTRGALIGGWALGG
jgi:hypothetical protein